MKIVHFCAGLESWNGMANTARQFVAEEQAKGYCSLLTADEDDVCGNIDVVHIHGAWLPVLWRVARRAKKIGARLIIRPAGSYDPIRRSYHKWRKRLVSHWEHRMLDQADTILATCSEETKWILAYHPRARVEVTDLKRFFRIKQEVRRPDSSRSMHVLYVGRRHPLKGVRYLERAVADLNENGVRAFELRLVSNHFGDELNHDWEWSDVLVLPTLSENFGRVVAEALERGKPVITTDGAPVWEDQPGVVFIRGFRNGTDSDRVRLLADALRVMCQ